MFPDSTVLDIDLGSMKRQQGLLYIEDATLVARYPHILALGNKSGSVTHIMTDVVPTAAKVRLARPLQKFAWAVGCHAHIEFLLGDERNGGPWDRGPANGCTVNIQVHCNGTGRPQGYFSLFSKLLHEATPELPLISVHSNSVPEMGFDVRQIVGL